MLTDEPSELAQLRALASKATPGPWAADPDIVASDYAWSVYADRGGGQGPEVCHCGQGEHDARFIAAASPTAVLALFDKLAGLAREAIEAAAMARLLRERVAELEAECAQQFAECERFKAQRDAAAARAGQRLAERDAALATLERVREIVAVAEAKHASHYHGAYAASAVVAVADLLGERSSQTEPAPRTNLERVRGLIAAWRTDSERTGDLPHGDRTEHAEGYAEAQHDLADDLEAALASPR